MRGYIAPTVLGLGKWEGIKITTLPYHLGARNVGRNQSSYITHAVSGLAGREAIRGAT